MTTILLISITFTCINMLLCGATVYTAFRFCKDVIPVLQTIKQNQDILLATEHITDQLAIYRRVEMLAEHIQLVDAKLHKMGR